MGQALADYSDKGVARDARAFCHEPTMFVIVGKDMLLDAAPDCQDEYAGADGGRK
jgi:hypothetical protein